MIFNHFMAPTTRLLRVVNKAILYPFFFKFFTLFSGLRQLFFLHTNDHMCTSKVIQQC